MKKFILIAIAAFGLITVQSCKKEPSGDDQNNGGGSTELTVEKKNRAVLVYHSATWCPPCGAVGGPLLKRLETTYGSDLVYLNVQNGGSSPSSIAPLFTRNDTAFYSPIIGGILGQVQLSGYIPYFYINNKAFGTGSESQIKQEISASTSSNVVAGIAASATASGNTVNFKVKTKFFESASGDYHLSIFLAEDKVVWTQNVNGTNDPNYVHPKVLRSACIGTMEWQQAVSTNAIASGAIAANTEVSKDYSWTYTLNKSKIPNGYNVWNFTPTNHYAIVVLWKKNGSKYEPVNGITVAVK